ncbi:MAG: TM0996/MTH895 family glutaredoxin-like protein [Candidatus Brocadiae bacterium]|nr:TM0996/MTH895 family glutaredoxin-like protein [Candidatus Brocadiia bacterium]
MKVEVLGPGCPKCEKLLANTKEAIKQLGVNAEVTKVTNIADFAKYGVMFTPALVVDGKLKFAGKVPNVEELKKSLS